MTKKPQKRDDFLSPADERNYLSDVIEYFRLEGHGGRPDESAAIERFEALLNQSAIDDGSIMLQDHWALLYEVQGDLQKAVAHRRREIELIEQLFSIEGPVGPINPRFLSETLKRLAHDYLRLGRTNDAGQILRRIEDLEL